MSYWWHSAASSAASSPPAIATPATVAAIGAIPTSARRGSAIAPLAGPENLIITNLAETQLTLSWNPVVGASRYDIERNGFIVVFNWQSTQYDDGNLTPNTTYTYRVNANP